LEQNNIINDYSTETLIKKLGGNTKARRIYIKKLTK